MKFKTGDEITVIQHIPHVQYGGVITDLMGLKGKVFGGMNRRYVVKIEGIEDLASIDEKDMERTDIIGSPLYQALK